PVPMCAFGNVEPPPQACRFGPWRPVPPRLIRVIRFAKVIAQCPRCGVLNRPPLRISLTNYPLAFPNEKHAFLRVGFFGIILPRFSASNPGELRAYRVRNHTMNRPVGRVVLHPNI